MQLLIGYSVRARKPNVPAVDIHTTRVQLARRAHRDFKGLGRQIAALLDVETPVPGVTTGKIRDNLKEIAVFKRLDGKLVGVARGKRR